MGELQKVIKGSFAPILNGQNNKQLFGPMVKLIIKAHGEQPSREIVAMIDTGAEMCLVDMSVALEMSLIKTRMSQTGTAGAFIERQMFAAEFVFPTVAKIYGVEAGSGDLSNMPYKAIIGQQILHRFDLFTSRSKNTVTLTLAVQ